MSREFLVTSLIVIAPPGTGVLYTLAKPHPLASMLTLGGVFMLLTIVVFVGHGLFVAAIRKHVTARPPVLAWMRRTFAAAFVALGAKLALAER